jgi:hypothetical protein
MTLHNQLKAICRTLPADGGATTLLDLGSERTVDVVGRSVRWVPGGVVMMARDNGRRKVLAVDLEESGLAVHFSGERRQVEPDVEACLGELNHANAAAVREVCEGARPQPVGLDDSFGLGDRIDEVMDAATWAVLEEGWEGPWGADADHLKTAADVELMAAAGFTMFTIDPGDHVVDAADGMTVSELEEAAAELPWSDLDDKLAEAVDRYADHGIEVGSGLTLEPSAEDVLRGWVKYGASLAHTARMYRHIASTMGKRPFEVEVSVDETASVTTPFEHWLVASELRRLGVEWVGLAPRFVGDFEKGIDYHGDLEVFRMEYLAHLAIAESLGPYKISIHSGSDKFGVYRVIGEIGVGGVHVKTAGTSYLEALRTVAACEPGLFREILDFSRSLYEHERRTYHVSAELERVPAGRDLRDRELAGLFEDEDARQVLHVTFGRVLTEKTNDGRYLFKGRLLTALDVHEKAHYDNLVAHFRRHTAPFGAGGES